MTGSPLRSAAARAGGSTVVGSGCVLIVLRGRIGPSIIVGPGGRLQPGAAVRPVPRESPDARSRDRRRRPRPLLVVRRRPALPRLPRRRVGPRAARRRRGVRAALAGGVPGRALVADDPPQAGGVPGRVRGVLDRASRGVRRARRGAAAGDAGIIRHRGKIEATIGNAVAALEIEGGLSELVWSFAPAARAARVPVAWARSRPRRPSRSRSRRS